MCLDSIEELEMFVEHPQQYSPYHLRIFEKFLQKAVSEMCKSEIPILYELVNTITSPHWMDSFGTKKTEDGERIESIQ